MCLHTVAASCFWTFNFTNWTSTLRYVGLFLEASRKKKKKASKTPREISTLLRLNRRTALSPSQTFWGWTLVSGWDAPLSGESFSGVKWTDEWMNEGRERKQRRSRRTRSNIIINITINPKRSADRIYKTQNYKKKKKKLQLLPSSCRTADNHYFQVFCRLLCGLID